MLFLYTRYTETETHKTEAIWPHFCRNQTSFVYAEYR